MYNSSQLKNVCKHVCDARHIRDLDVLRDVAHEMATSTEQRDVLRNILRILNRQPQLMNGTIMLLDSDANTLTVEELGDEHANSKKQLTYQRGEGIVGKVLESGQACIVPRISEEPIFQNRIHQRTAKEDVSFICTPILLGNETLGVLSIDHEMSSDETLKEAERFLCIIASMIAYDIHNRRIHRIERDKLEAEKLQLISELKPDIEAGKMLGTSDPMRHVFSRIKQVAPTDVTVLIRGESGTGKELAAAAIHYNSLRAKKPFVKVNCAALNEGVLESELFGHEKGAFTGASFARNGRISEAEGGTLFLDEIGDFSASVQVKLLRVIQEREYESVGSNKTLQADVRILAASNRDLEALIREKAFREDLYYRINVFPLYLPPLRNRRSDILLLANYFSQKHAVQVNRAIHRISSTAINLLMSYHWPGNVRELENCIAHAVLMCNDGVIQGRHFPPRYKPRKEYPKKIAVRCEVEWMFWSGDMIVDALKRHQGNIKKASQDLGITDRMVRYKIKNLNVNYEELFKKYRR